MNRYTIGVIEKHLYHVDVEATNADEAEQKAVDLLVNDDNPMENFPNSYEGFEFDSIVETTEPPKRRIRIVHDDSPESPSRVGQPRHHGVLAQPIHVGQ
jgi:hypothetical protein